ncbi:hypothetical protein FQ154_01720 [Paeniglutamicibacter gangotriensis]|uniref:Uncharacterized protein n=1 Tax=Paeniglutamicibacter gangotriensis TaxID=254787 RepID=A0A5B0EM72_9MICC|nr:hypothetical protein [Paeniglutamicibacter gangotriensis]KAA0979903.1 hypothetical protein FQ154_01720 [Paeniglutamicibacter gangotriensis]
MSNLEARIAEVVAATDKAHAFRMADYSDNERPIYRCACGVEAIGMHHEHHREALTAALLAMSREAQAEAWQECVHIYDSMVCLDCEPNAPTNPYRADNLATP